MLLCWNNRGDYHSASDILGIGEVNTIAFIIPMGFQSSATSGAKLCEAQRSKSPAQNRQREGYSDTAQRQPRTQPNTHSHRLLTKSNALRLTPYSVRRSYNCSEGKDSRKNRCRVRHTRRTRHAFRCVRKLLIKQCISTTNVHYCNLSRENSGNNHYDPYRFRQKPGKRLAADTQMSQRDESE